MAQSHTALRAISRLLGKCQRGSHWESQLPPHPSPLPQGEGESSADFRHSLARCLPDEPPEQPNPSPAVPSPRGRGSEMRGIRLPFNTATRTISEIVELLESSGSAGGFS